MPVNYNFKRGVDLPSWHWLNQVDSGSSNPGTSNNYDGVRYMYWMVQTGSATAASTTRLYRFDTWNNGWHLIGNTPSSCFSGLDMEYDPIRNVIWYSEGNNTTVWRYFNLNTTSVTILGVTTAAWAFSAAMTVVLPAAANTWAALDHASDGDVPALLTIRGTTTDKTTGIATAASTTTSIVDTTAEFHAGLIGCYVRFTSGPLSSVQRVITAVPNSTTLTVNAFSAAPTAGNPFVVEVPGGRPDLGVGPTGLNTTSATVSTIVATGSGWPVNVYRDADVVIVSGTGAGQRRRIASNTIDTLTLAATVAGNARTGNWTTTPDATSVFRIIPSEDFLYYATATAALYRVDLAATTITWTTMAAPLAAFGTGGQVMRTPSFAPFSIVAVRGANSNTAYRFDIGLNTWTTLTTLWGGELATTGATTVRMPNRHRFYMIISATQRSYIWNPVVGTLEPVTLLPYTVASAYDGKRARYVKTPDGVEWLYVLRAGGQEFWRLALEWVD